MARPHKQNAEYHTHDKDMRNDPKIRALRKKYGHEGYSIFNMMLEVLTNSRCFKTEWNPTAITILEGDFDTDILEEVINYCISPLGLFIIENQFIFSYRHIERFESLLSKRKRERKEVIVDDNTQRKEKKIKENKNKKRGLYFLPEEGVVVVEDDSRQPLSETQKFLLAKKEIKPSEIFKIETE